MLDIKITGRKKGKVIRFRNKFSELDVSTFCLFREKEEKLDVLEPQLLKAEAELKALPDDAPDLENLVIVIDAHLQDLDRQIRAVKIELLALLSTNYKKTVNYLINTRGVSQRLINAALLAIRETMNDFEGWAMKIKLVNKFRFTDYKKADFWNFNKVQDFEVFNTDSNSVLRDSAAMLVARNIDTINTELAANRWTNLPKFLAFVCRPATEKEEIDLKDKKAFFGGSKLKGVSITDRLKAYNDLLAKTVELRTPIFNRLPLATAIGAYKQYFFLSRR